MNYEFSPYKLPIGSEFTLGKRRWRLIQKEQLHPDLMTFTEASVSPNTPDRVFNPSEVQHLFDLGIEFTIPLRRSS